MSLSGGAAKSMASSKSASVAKSVGTSKSVSATKRAGTAGRAGTAKSVVASKGAGASQSEVPQRARIPILTGICYRPPKDNNFYMNLETLLVPKVSFQNELLILGDFNTNVSKGPECGLKCKLMSFMNTFNMTQVIRDYTRVTNTTKSIIDLIMVSDVDKISQQGVLPSGLSDHLIIYCTRKTAKSLLNKNIIPPSSDL